MYSSYSIHLLVLTTAQYSCKISVMHRACAVLIFILFKSERETNTDVAYQELGQETPSWNMDVPSGDLATVPNAHVPCLRGPTLLWWLLYVLLTLSSLHTHFPSQAPGLMSEHILEL